MQNKGKLYGTGVGPGDPELVTLKALRIMREADVIAVPGEIAAESVAWKIAVQACPEIADKKVIALSMPMTKDKEVLAANHRKAAELLEAELNTGADVAYLMIGDPTIYSTYLYIRRLVSADGFETEIINGIPSFCAAAARTGEGLVELGEPLHVFPANYPVDQVLDTDGTCVLMKSGKKIKGVRELLGKEKKREVITVENCGMPNEKIYRGAEEIPDDAGYYSLIIVREEKA
ncbi:MAG: precorrin-2 C(20)-methyltransferase [Eubacterium sp.]|nr:precorrin-2 C(20)-methyltransferase [Eubacterium sp.]